MPTRNRNTPDELVLCTYAALYDASDFGGTEEIFALGFRSMASITMKIQNIAAMLDEEGIERQNSVKGLSGRPKGKTGRRTDWNFVSSIISLPQNEFLTRCRSIIDNARILPGELGSTRSFREGSVRQVTVNAYERDPAARKACIERFGTRCVICELDFADKYGLDAKGFIHVHHLRPLSEIGEEYIVDPIQDLQPVCPNCHSVIHLGGNTRSIDEVKAMLIR